MSEWISVKDRLPEPGHRAVICTNNIKARDSIGQMSHLWIGFIIESCDGEYVTFDNADRRIHNITHWTPLPVPPEAAH